MKVAVVKLNESNDVVKIVAGKEKNSNYPKYENREYRQGLSVFYNDKYILSFVTLESTVRLLESDHDVKVINDLGYILIAEGYQLRILHNWGTIDRGSDSDFILKFPQDLNNKTGYYGSVIFQDVHLTSNNPGAFSKAISIALSDPYTETNLPIHIPCGAEEVLL
jgi:hypothetical protein